MTPKAALAWIAFALGGLAPIAGSPYASNHGRIDVAQLASVVAHEEDHVTAIELAEWIKVRKPGLRVIDVRTKKDFDEFHIPTSEHVPIESIASASLGPSETIVLYSDGGAHAAQAWVFLRALGYRQVYFLRGGLYDWIDDVLNPTIGSGASPAERAAFERTSAISRYFGGTPRVTDSAAPADAGRVSPPGGASSGSSLATAVARVKRRRC